MKKMKQLFFNLIFLDRVDEQLSKTQNWAITEKMKHADSIEIS